MRMLSILFCMAFFAAAYAEPPWRHVSKEREAAIRATLPKTDDLKLKSLLASDLIFYDQASLPGLFQDTARTQSPRPGEHSDYVRLVFTGRNIAPEELDPAGSPNQEAPWQKTAGLPSGYPTVLALSLPSSGTIDIRVGRDPEAYGRVYDLVTWEFPVGTTVMEILYQKFSDGDILPFEIRTRTKAKQGFGADNWTENQYRPVRNERELSQAAFIPLRRNPVAELLHLPTAHPSFLAQRTAWRVRLPDLGGKEVAKAILKQTPFKSTLGEPWLSKDGYDCAVATAEGPDSIVPPGYNGDFFQVGKKTCINCHQDTQKHAFDIQNPRQWYGYVRGSDGIFTWHPFEVAQVVDMRTSPKSVISDRLLNTKRVRLLK